MLNKKNAENVNNKCIDSISAFSTHGQYYLFKSDILTLDEIFNKTHNVAVV